MVLGRHLYVFGGLFGYHLLDKIESLNVTAEKARWESYYQTRMPPRQFAAVCGAGDQIMISGGYDFRNKDINFCYLDDILIFNTTSGVIERVGAAPFGFSCQT